MRAPSELEAVYAQAVARLRGAPGSAHLMGIGGVGVAGLAPLLQARGWRISGCDLGDNRITQWLAGRGVAVARSHDPRHLDRELGWLIRSSAVPADHPEVLAARTQGAFVCARGVALAALVRDARSVAVGGTHGKTTTTAMIAQIAQQTDPAAGWAIGAFWSSL